MPFLSWQEDAKEQIEKEATKEAERGMKETIRSGERENNVEARFVAY